MQRQFVESSVIEWIGYDEATKTLSVRFRSGGLYDYCEVPREEYESLMRAPSHGKYFLAHIKDVYPYRKAKVR